jgi:hypothetical protein
MVLSTARRIYPLPKSSTIRDSEAERAQLQLHEYTENGSRSCKIVTNVVMAEQDVK